MKLTQHQLKHIKKEICAIEDFISARENSGFAFSLSQAQERLAFLQKVLDKTLKENL